MVVLGVVAVVVCFCIGIAPFGVWILGYKKSTALLAIEI